MFTEQDIRQVLLDNPKNRPALRSQGNYKITDLKGVVIHWTANVDTGADAMANRNYFNSGVRFASAHYVVDSTEVVQCIPDDEVAWHVGDTPRFKDLPVRDSIKYPNHQLLGIEMCVNVDGDWLTTYYRTVELVKYLLVKHDLNVNHVYRHFDVTGKNCPMMFLPIKVGSDSYNWNWMLFKAALLQITSEPKIIEKEVVVYKEPNFSTKRLLYLLLLKMWSIWPWGK